MTILITGVCGNVGQYVAKKLLEKGSKLIGIDILNKDTKKVANDLNKVAKQYHTQIVFYWNSLDPEKNELEKILTQYKVESIIHLAFILPPFSELDPQYAQKVNVEATRYLIESAKKYAKEAAFIFSSSTTVFGSVATDELFINENHSTKATSHYTANKLACEEMLQNSDLDWRILRFSAVMSPVFKPRKESIQFGLNIDLKVHVEPVHVKDVAEAVYHALIRKEASRKIFIISGGKRNQTTYQDYAFKIIAGILGNIKYQDIPWHKFTPKPYYLHWYDTTASEAILTYQRHTIEDYLKDTQKMLSWWKKALILLPVVKKYAIKTLFP